MPICRYKPSSLAARTYQNGRGFDPIRPVSGTFRDECLTGIVVARDPTARWPSRICSAVATRSLRGVSFFTPERGGPFDDASNAGCGALLTPRLRRLDRHDEYPQPRRPDSSLGSA